MAFESETEELIRTRMLSKVKNSDKEEGSFIWDALSPTATELAYSYMALNSILLRAFPQTSYEEWLDLIAEDHGLTRKNAVKAKGSITVIGAIDTVIPKNSIVQTENNLQYVTLEEKTILNESGAIINVEAVQAGTKYNINENKIKSFATNINGVISLTNAEKISGGADIETDDELRERIIFKVKIPASCGNKYHYEKWALEVEGVGAVKVFPIWNGPGTVKIVAIDSNKKPINSAMIDKIATHIEEERPIGAEVTIQSAKTLDVDVRIRVKKSISTEVFKEKVKIIIEDYFKKMAFKSDYISISILGAKILEIDGVEDYDLLYLNEKPENVNIPSETVAVLREVIVVE